MKWPIFLVLTLAQLLIISAGGRGHGPKQPFLIRDEDYDENDGPESVDYDDYDQTPEQTSYHRHDGSDREENQVVNAFGNDDEDDEDQPEEGSEETEHDVEEQDEDEQPEEDAADQEDPNWDAKPAEREDHEGTLTDHIEGDHFETRKTEQKKPQPDETEIVPRTNWGAEPAKREYALELPVKQVWFTYSTDHTSPCRSFKQCARNVLDLQSKCLTSSHLTDIPFNFLIGGDGRVYVGRGWKVQPPASALEPAIGGNRMDIAFLGNLTRETMSPKMKRAVRDLVDYGVAHNYISPTYTYKEWDSSGVRSKDTGV